MSTTYQYLMSEEMEQQVVMQWARAMQNRWPELGLLHHCPNGGSRNKREAARLKRMGVLAGVPDLHLPIARAGYIGLYIEMKYAAGRLQDSQKIFLTSAAAEMNYCVVCYTADDAIEVLRHYLDGETIYPDLAVIARGEVTGEVKTDKYPEKDSGHINEGI